MLLGLAQNEKPSASQPESSPAAVLCLAVFGAGAFGQNHIRIYRQQEQEGLPVRLAAVVDPLFTDPASPACIAALEKLNLPPSVRIFSSAEQCLAAHQSGELSLHAASICTPTSMHAAVGMLALDAGLHMLVEKPITRTLEEADALIARAKARGLRLQAGHLERFNPAVRAFIPYLNHPMFFEAHRLSIFTPRSLDVDVVLDLMIHDLDIVLAFAQSPVHEVRAVGLPILSGKTDIANVRLQFASGAIANFTASRVSTERVRKLRFFQPHQYVSIDYARQEILMIQTKGADVRGADARVESMAGSLGSTPVQLPHASGLNLTKPAIEPGEPLRLEIVSFLDAIRNRTTPIVPGEAGRAALALALEINAAIQKHNEQFNVTSRECPR